MNFPLIITPEAEADLADARAWYEQQRVGLGDDFLVCVEEAFNRIQRMPLTPRTIFQDIRRSLVHRFPYGVFYKVTSDHIAVIAVYHLRRDPRGWQSRA